ncbi:hypothetical protein [Streptomyces sp. CdTB01]|uniref:hypothetical protein n=1 Tax=Streptomyces sp. CdTB01 TaxID=1725411 RepID=UPI00073AE050|nr:hypothetical protein [Streptomyces sp. CdTB01]ALV33156.1 hypothetical protein AS200_14730 [Streptomyces sp. CdTB01]
MSTLVGMALLAGIVCDSVRRIIAARGPCGVLLARLGGRRAAAGAAECRVVRLLLAQRIDRAAYRRAMDDLAHKSWHPYVRVPAARRAHGVRGRAE